MKKILKVFLAVLVFSGCATNPFTGQKTMAFISNDELFSMASAQYNEFLNEADVVTGTPESEMVERVGNNIVAAAKKWLERQGNPDYVDQYQWEFRLVRDNSVNAWAMPGGKIVFYTGILAVTQDEAGIAVVMGHEIAHALLNHGQQRMSAGILQQVGATVLQGAFSGTSDTTQALVLTAFGLGSNLFGTLPFSRENEYEADEYGLNLMAIAGYNPDAAVDFWQRMMDRSGGGGGSDFLSTHPSDARRVSNMQRLTGEAKRLGESFGVRF